MRTLIIIVCLIVSVIVLMVTFAQRRELVSLKLEETKLQQRATDVAEPVVQPIANVTAAPPAQHNPSPELLRLRGEVGQLERRKRELSSVRAENERLRTQLTIKGTNAPGTFALPAGYIKKSEAKFAGYSTPEDTIQSMLWAIQHRDTATFIQAFNPEAAKQMEAEIERRGSAEEFFKEAEAMPGLRIIGKEAESNDTTVLTMEMIPGDESSSQKVRFKQFAGQWKLVSGF